MIPIRGIYEVTIPVKAVVAVALAIVVSGGGDSTPSARATDDHALSVPTAGWEEEDQSEAEERTFTPEQAGTEGNRSTPANRASAPMPTAARLGNARPISGPTPLGGCPGLPGTTDNYEAEPDMAINPRDPNNLIVAWQQDRSYAARGTVASFTRDGGRSWRTVTVPGADTCQPGTDALAVADPWLTFDRAGTAYLASLPGSGFPSASDIEIRASIIVNRSTNGGESWSEPSVVVPANGFNDKPTLTADPRREGVVYAVWEKSGGSECSDGGGCAARIYFSRSMDGAQSWSAPSQLAAPAEDVGQHNARLLVLRDGSLRGFFEQGERSEPRRLMMVGSDDQGETWSEPRLLLTQTNRLPTADGSEPFFAIYEEAVNIDPAGRSLYLAFADSTSDDAHSPSAVWLRRSTDGGRRWSKREVVAKLPAFAMLPSVAADTEGRVAVTWYDFTRDVPGDGKATATYRTAVRKPGQRRFRLGALGSFDVNECGKFSAPLLPGPKWPWIGEYVGLVPQPRGFATAFVGCGELSELGPEDILFAKFR
jgi:hypothetical protein